MQRRVHEILLTGRYVAPAYYHNHDVRLDELRRFMNGPEFVALSPDVQGLFVRYERDTLRLQAVTQLEREALVQQATAEFQARQARQAARQQALQQMGGLVAGAPPGERPGIERVLSGPAGRVLRGFLTQAQTAA
jgi:hypothetical protein